MKNKKFTGQNYYQFVAMDQKIAGSFTKSLRFASKDIATFLNKTFFAPNTLFKFFFNHRVQICCNFAHTQIVSFQTYQLVKPINRPNNKLILARINFSNGEIIIFLTLIESRNINTKTSYQKPNYDSFTRLETILRKK